MNDDDLMPFGKHKGERMENVPDSYLAWLWNDGYWNKVQSPLHHYIKSAMSEIGKKYVMKRPPDAPH